MADFDRNYNFNLDLQATKQAWIALNLASKIGIISHRSPDPDTIGSNLTLCEFLTSLGKQVTPLCVDLPPQSLNFLPQLNLYQQNLNPADYDLLISVDCGSIEQTAFNKQYPDIFLHNFINIDHHSSNNNFGQINIVNTQLSSTSEIIYQLLKHWGHPLTPSISTYLLAGLYFDTGSFMHSNTTPQVLQMAEDLLQNGADQNTIIRNLYQNFTLSKFHLWGQTLSNFQLTPQNSVISIVQPDNYQKTNSTSEELGGLINYLNMVKNNDYTVLINQDDLGVIKGSIRTSKNDVNVSEIAQTLGGGGHKKASGFTLPGNITKEFVWKVIN